MSSHRTVVVTGGTAGIGRALVRRYAASGARVVVAARRRGPAEALQAELPGLVSVVCDLARPEGRTTLAAAVADLGPWDVLVNNAGVQRRVPIARDDDDWPAHQYELDLLLAAPIHLTTMLLPGVLARGGRAQVVNVTSGGAFVPQPFAPAYSAAKAGLHSWTLTLRHALAGTGVQVTELVPPAVATGLGDGAPHGADPDVFADTVFPQLEAGADVVGFGPTATAQFRALVADAQARFDAGSTRFPVDRFATAAAG